MSLVIASNPLSPVDRNLEPVARIRSIENLNQPPFIAPLLPSAETFRDSIDKFAQSSKDLTVFTIIKKIFNIKLDIINEFESGYGDLIKGGDFSTQFKLFLKEKLTTSQYFLASLIFPLTEKIIDLAYSSIFGQIANRLESEAHHFVHQSSKRETILKELESKFDLIVKMHEFEHKTASPEKLFLKELFPLTSSFKKPERKALFALIQDVRNHDNKETFLTKIGQSLPQDCEKKQAICHLVSENYDLLTDLTYVDDNCFLEAFKKTKKEMLETGIPQFYRELSKVILNAFYPKINIGIEKSIEKAIQSLDKKLNQLDEKNPLSPVCRILLNCLKSILIFFKDSIIQPVGKAFDTLLHKITLKCTSILASILKSSVDTVLSKIEKTHAFDPVIQKKINTSLVDQNKKQIEKLLSSLMKTEYSKLKSLDDQRLKEELFKLVPKNYSNIFIQNFLNSTIQVKSPHELKELLQKSIEVSNCEEPKEIYSMNPLLSLEENATLERLISKVFQMLSSSQIQGSILHQSCGFFVDKIVSQFKAKGHEATLKQYSKLINEDTLFTGLSKVISGLEKGGLHNVGETTASNPVDPKVIDQENECFDQLLHQNINIMYHLNVVSAPQKASNIFARFCHKAFDTVSSLSGNGDTEKFASTYISEKVKDLKGTLLNKRAIPVAIYSALLNTV